MGAWAEALRKWNNKCLAADPACHILSFSIKSHSIEKETSHALVTVWKKKKKPLYNRQITKKYPFIMSTGEIVILSYIFFITQGSYF